MLGEGKCDSWLQQYFCSPWLWLHLTSPNGFPADLLWGTSVPVLSHPLAPQAALSWGFSLSDKGYLWALAALLQPFWWLPSPPEPDIVRVWVQERVSQVCPLHGSRRETCETICPFTLRTRIAAVILKPLSCLKITANCLPGASLSPFNQLN